MLHLSVSKYRKNNLEKKDKERLTEWLVNTEHMYGGQWTYLNVFLRNHNKDRLQEILIYFLTHYQTTEL